MDGTLRGFAELHHFAGGLKIEPHTKDKMRPEWAPPKELAAFNREFDLGEGAVVIEFLRSAHQGLLCDWLGIYRPAVDAVYGDRQNFIGIGIWLTGGQFFDFEYAIDALTKLLHAAKDGVSAQIVADVDTLLAPKQLEAFAVPQSAPSELYGMPYATGSVPKTDSHFVGIPLLEAMSEISAHLVSLLVLPRSELSASRVLILASDGEVPRGLRSAVKLPARRRTAKALIEGVPSVSIAVESKLQAVREKLDATEVAMRQAKDRLIHFGDELAKTKTTNDTLQNELAKAREQIMALENEEPAERGFRQTFSALKAQETELRQLRAKLNEVVDLVKTRLGPKTGHSPENRAVPGPPSTGHRPQARKRGIPWFDVAVAVVGICAVAALVYFFLRLVS